MLRMEFRIACRAGLLGVLIMLPPIFLSILRLPMDSVASFITVRAFPVLRSFPEEADELLLFVLLFGGIVLLVSSLLGFGAFRIEFRDRAFEYLFSFPLSRGRILTLKLLPRFLVLMVFLSIYEILSSMYLVPVRAWSGPLFFLFDPRFFPALIFFVFFGGFFLGIYEQRNWGAAASFSAFISVMLIFPGIKAFFRSSLLSEKGPLLLSGMSLTAALFLILVVLVSASLWVFRKMDLRSPSFYAREFAWRILIPIALLAPLVFGVCCSKSDRVEKIMEQGVEVVLNHVKPYRLGDKPREITFTPDFVIDTEQEDLSVGVGLTDIGTSFDVDSLGCLYLVNLKSDAGLIFKFDSRGRFLKVFAGKGQGPGEIQGGVFPPLYLNVTSDDVLSVTDYNNHKLIRFSLDGDLLDEKKLDPSFLYVHPLPGAGYLVWRREIDPAADQILRNPLCLYSEVFEEIRVLDRQLVPNHLRGERIPGTYHVLSWALSGSRIFTGFQERGYDILVYDFSGRLFRRIHKEHEPVPVPEEHKGKILKEFESPLLAGYKSKLFFPKAMPPFHAFFSDEDGWLFVMTYKKAGDNGKYWYDVFNPDGIFVCRTALDIYSDNAGVYARIKNGRLYALREKASGFRELAVFRVDLNIPEK